MRSIQTLITHQDGSPAVKRSGKISASLIMLVNTEWFSKWTQQDSNGKNIKIKALRPSL